MAVVLLLIDAAGASADLLPYRTSTALPSPVSSPPMAADAPYTPLVKRLIAQLEPNRPPTLPELLNADAILHGTNTSNCTTVGSNAAPSGTNPVISPLCWADALGVNVTSGAQVRQTTAPPLRVGMASSWDPRLLNAWGQTEGREGRWLGATGLYAPQADLMRIPDWGRNLTLFGEDPFQDGTLAAAEINGVQGAGMMAQVKHFAMYDGQTEYLDSEVQDQAAHELYLQPYEYGTSGSRFLSNPGQAAAMMCSYARYEIVAAPGVSGAPPSELHPAGGAQACDNQLKNYAAHREWGWPGFIASDYTSAILVPHLAMDSTVQAIDSGTDQEMPNSVYFGAPLVAAVESGAVPLATFNAALARILYEEERFHLLGHADGDSNYLSPSHPISRTGAYALTAAQKAKDGALAERAGEEGAVLLKNAGRALPLTRRDLRKGILVVGESAEYMPADPGTEQANGYPDRDAISPLEQLRQFASCAAVHRLPHHWRPDRRGHSPACHPKITFLPYMPGAPPTAGDGEPVPQSLLSSGGARIGDGLERTGGPGSPRIDPQIDFTSVSGRGQLAFGKTYTWKGYIDVPNSDDYTFHFQFSVPSYAISSLPGFYSTGSVAQPSCSGSGAPTFRLAARAGIGQPMSSDGLSSSPSTVGSVIPTDPTMSGFTERGLANCVYQAGTLGAGVHQLQISWTAPASFSPDAYHLREPGSRLPSFRFAYSRAGADLAQAIAAARRAAKVIVFADCTCVSESAIDPAPAPVNVLDPQPTQLIEDMAGANPNTIVVTNFDVATLMPWLSRVRAVLQMWYPGGEGGTATARLLLGRADPGGHLTSTWPRSSTDTIFGYDETKPLYPGDGIGPHPERFGGNGPFINWTEGIFVGYRFFDREGIRPLFPFGWGLSYTSFRYSKLRLRRSATGLNVSFTVANTGRTVGAVVPQVYIGPAPSVPAGVQQAVRSLAGFDRVTLPSHRRRRLTIHLGPGKDIDGWGNRRAFQYWDTGRQAWETATGARRVWVGSADALVDLPLAAVARNAGRR